MDNVHGQDRDFSLPPEGEERKRKEATRDDFKLTPQFRDLFAGKTGLEDPDIILAFLAQGFPYQAAIAEVYGLGYPCADWGSIFWGTECPGGDPNAGIQVLAREGVREMKIRLGILKKQTPFSWKDPGRRGALDMLDRLRDRLKSIADDLSPGEKDLLGQQIDDLEKEIPEEDEIPPAAEEEDPPEESSEDEDVPPPPDRVVPKIITAAAVRLLGSDAFREDVGCQLTPELLEDKLMRLRAEAKWQLESILMRYGSDGGRKPFSLIAERRGGSPKTINTWVKTGLEFIRS